MSTKQKFILRKTEGLLQQVLDEQVKSNVLLQKILDELVKLNSSKIFTPADSEMNFPQARTIEVPQ